MEGNVERGVENGALARAMVDKSMAQGCLAGALVPLRPSSDAQRRMERRLERRI